MSVPPWGWFVVVGGAAALVHFGVVVMAVREFALAPLVANVLAWCVAFTVSYAGHRRLSFRAQAAPVRRSALRFAAVSLAGLGVNETAYALLLHLTPLRFDLALAVVLAAVAVVTYWLGRHWAFAGTPPAP